MTGCVCAKARQSSCRSAPQLRGPKVELLGESDAAKIASKKGSTETIGRESQGNNLT